MNLIFIRDFPQQNRYEELNIYYEDSKGNKKINHFVIYPVVKDKRYYLQEAFVQQKSY